MTSAILKGSMPLATGDTLIEVDESVTISSPLTQVQVLSCEAIIALVFNRPSVRLLERLLNDGDKMPGSLTGVYRHLLLVWLICDLGDVEAQQADTVLNIEIAKKAVSQLRLYAETLPSSPNFRKLFNLESQLGVF